MTVVDRQALSRARIASAALELIDATGIDGLSMRKLGAELGVEAMSLYHYVTSKSDLFDAVLDLLYTEIELPDVADDDWETAIRLGLLSFNKVLLRHESALELFATRRAPSEEAFRVLYWSHQRFLAVGLSIEDAHAALHFAVSFVMGHAANERGTMNQLRSDQSRLAEPLGDPELQAFVQNVDQITRAELFDTGLDMVVAGLRLRYDLP